MDAASEPSSPPTFDVIPLSAEVRRAVDDLGYVHPTPVQRAVFEPATRGLDLVVQARTGTGKTAAFGLPLVDSIVRKRDTVVQALVLCPTRELALQVTRELEALAKHKGTRVVPVYGGAPMPRQVDQIRSGAQIVVGTPGRVLDHLSRGTFEARSVRTLVLDESDEMLSMGFLPQITDILSYLPESRQTLLFSATLPPDIRRIAETRLRKPEFITLSGDQVGALEIRHFVYLSRGDKLTELLEILETEDPESAVIFANTRDETKRVAAALVQEGYAADWLNADLAQQDREKVMAATREGRLRFLVATDVAARGIDISHLTHVINFDFPESAEAYVHRTGRTGRAGRTGTAISLVEPSDIGNLYLLRLTYKLKPIERTLPSKTERKTRAETDLVRWFVEGFAARPVHPDDLALARRLLSHERAEVVVAGLLRDHLGARAEAQEEATAARRSRATRVAPEERSPEPRERESRPGAEPVAPREPSAARGASGGAPSASRERAVSDASARGSTAREPSTTRDASAPREPSARGPAPAHEAPAAVSDVSARAAKVDHEPAASVPAAGTPDLEPSSAPQSEAETTQVESVELYASVGRRQGARPGDYERLLAEAGIPAEAVAYVRVRHRNAFVGVAPDVVERALQALDGKVVAGARVKAEPSRGRAKAPVESEDGEPASDAQ